MAKYKKNLMEDGIVARKSYDEIPPRVEYTLTEKGKSVVPILQSICQWSDSFYKEDLYFNTGYQKSYRKNREKSGI